MSPTPSWVERIADGLPLQPQSALSALPSYIHVIHQLTRCALGAQFAKRGECSRRSLQRDPRARRLALLVEGYAEDWSSWELANVSCAEVELELGSPALLDKVRSRPGPAE